MDIKDLAELVPAWKTMTIREGDVLFIGIPAEHAKSSGFHSILSRLRKELNNLEIPVVFVNDQWEPHVVRREDL